MPSKYDDEYLADQAAGCLLFGVGLVIVGTIQVLNEVLSAPPSGIRVGRKLTSLGPGRTVGIPNQERLKHAHVIGPTGSGKTTLLKNLIIKDIQAGNGIGVIDPKGDLINEVLEHIPAHRLDDVVLFDATDKEFPLGFNILEAVDPDERSRTAGEAVSIFKKLFIDFWGPRLEHILRYSVLTLLEVPGSTLLDIPDILLDEHYRNALLPNVTNFSVRNFWEQEYQTFSKSFRTQAISPILNKVGPWLAYPEVRNIVGQVHSSFHIRSLMDQHKILLVNIPQSLGEDTSSLLGAMLVSKIQLAAMTRAGLPGHQKPAFFLYVDEFQNFVTSAFEKILTEARSFGLGLVVANQYREQLARNTFDERLIHTLDHNVAVRLTCYFEEDHYRVLYEMPQDVKAENLIIQPDPPARGGDKDLPQRIRRICRQRYGRPRREVEDAILGRLRRRAAIVDYYGGNGKDSDYGEWLET